MQRIGTRLDSSDDDIHVLPLGDLVEHEQSRKCWCVPMLEQHVSMLVTHHSADGREQDESEAERAVAAMFRVIAES
jgi:hypothetical protein